MPGGLTLLASANVDIPTPPAGKATIFFSLTSGIPSYKDDSGTVYPLGSGGGGSVEFVKIGVNGAIDADAVAIFYGQYYSPLVDDGNSGTTKTIDWNDGNEHYVVMTGNVTFTFSNPVDGGRYVLLLATGAGSFTVTWPASVIWSGGVAPTPTSTASKYDLYAFMYVATLSKYVGVATLNFS